MSQENQPISVSTGVTQSPSEIAPINRYALVPTNPTVVMVSKAFKWKPETMIARIKRALPDAFEQQVYLSVAEAFRIHPETLAKLLLIWRGTQPLSINDLEWRKVGHNAVSNSFGDFTDFLEACIRLVKVITRDYEAFGLSITMAAHIVIAYGSNSPEQVIEMIETNLDDCCESFGVSQSHPWSMRLRMCTWVFITKILPELQSRGVPNPLNTEMFIGDVELQRYCMGEEFVIDPFEDETTQRLVKEMINGGVL